MMVAMSARQSLRVALFSTAVFSLHAAYVAPARTTAMLRAAHCCATRCHRPQSATTTARCCHVQQGVADVATLATGKPVLQQLTATPLLTLSSVADLANFSSFLNYAPRYAIPPAVPLFLFTRTLRL